MAKKKAAPKAKAEKTTLERVEQGQKWLAEHDADPPGRNYIWYKAGIRPGQKMGKHVTDATKEAYAVWHKAYGMWLRLYAQLESENNG